MKCESIKIIIIKICACTASFVLSDEVLINLCPLLNRSLAIVSVVMDVQSSCYGHTSLKVMDVHMTFALFKIIICRIVDH